MSPTKPALTHWQKVERPCVSVFGGVWDPQAGLLGATPQLTSHQVTAGTRRSGNGPFKRKKHQTRTPQTSYSGCKKGGTFDHRRVKRSNLNPPAGHGGSQAPRRRRDRHLSLEGRTGGLHGLFLGNLRKTNRDWEPRSNWTCTLGVEAIGPANWGKHRSNWT